MCNGWNSVAYGNGRLYACRCDETLRLVALGCHASWTTGSSWPVDGKPMSVVSDGDTVRTFRSNTKWGLLPLSVAARCAWVAVVTDNEMFVAAGFPFAVHADLTTCDVTRHSVVVETLHLRGRLLMDHFTRQLLLLTVTKKTELYANWVLGGSRLQRCGS